MKWATYCALIAAPISVFAAVAQMPSNPTEATGVTIREILPSVADPAINSSFDEASLVFVPAYIRYHDLVVFLPGTHGRPAGYKEMLEEIASTGIRVVGLMYNDVPMSKQACAEQDDENCAGNFRRERVDGGVANPPVQNSMAESIQERLVHLLQFERKEYPREGWGRFLKGDQPNWRRICISGHSQGAGMAAYIAKEHRVARVVLFSGGPDGYNYRSGTPTLAAWVLKPSKTPMDRWWTEYHTREPSAKLLPKGYAALELPPENILVFDKGLPSDMHEDRPVSYHVAVTHDARYLQQWKQMFGVQ